MRLIPSDGIIGSSVGLKGSREDEQTFVLEYDEIASTSGYRLRLSFTEPGVKVRAKERTGLQERIGLFDEKFGGNWRAKDDGVRLQDRQCKLSYGCNLRTEAATPDERFNWGDA